MTNGVSICESNLQLVINKGLEIAWVSCGSFNVSVIRCSLFHLIPFNSLELILFKYVWGLKWKTFWWFAWLFSRLQNLIVTDNRTRLSAMKIRDKNDGCKSAFAKLRFSQDSSNQHNVLAHKVDACGSSRLHSQRNCKSCLWPCHLTLWSNLLQWGNKPFHLDERRVSTSFSSWDWV